MPDSPSIADQITELAGTPRIFEADGQKVGERSISELIEADKYLTQKANASASSRPFKISQVRPGGLW